MLTTIDPKRLDHIVGGAMDAEPYSMPIDGWTCDVGAHFQNSQIGPYGGGITACSDNGTGAPLSDRLRAAFRNGGFVPGVVDPDGRYGQPTKPPAR